MSLCWVGCTHDFSMLKEEFPPNKNWFKNHKIRLDLDYQGFQHDYTCKELSIPKKKKKGSSLSLSEKENSKFQSKNIIAVQHSFSSLNRYQALVNRLRIKNFDYYNNILGICAGLWNYYLSH